MRYYKNKHQFYTSKEFYDFKTMLMHKRVNNKGELLCEECGKLLLKRHDTIPHHYKTPLTNENVNDRNISLNEDNIQLVCFKCHNKLEKRFSKVEKNIYLVVGAPCSGKSSFVNENAIGEEDIIFDFDKIWQAISNNDKYIKPNRLKPVAFAMRECLLEQIKMRNGKWINAYILTTDPYLMSRKRLCDSLGVTETIYMDADKETCLKRLYSNPEGRDIQLYEKLIEDYYKNFQREEQFDS